MRGKNDTLDAARAARAALASDRLALPRSGERREALRLLLVARRSAVDVRREALTQLRAVIVTAPDESPGAPRAADREAARTLPAAAPDARSRRRPARDTARARSLARRIEAATTEADALEHEILTHVRALAPTLLDEPGVGPIVAAQLIVSLVTQRTRPFRSSICPPRRRRTDPRLSGQTTGRGSAAAATASSTEPSTPSSSTAASTTPRRRSTSNDASQTARPRKTPPGSSSATSPATSTGPQPGATHDLTVTGASSRTLA